MTKAEMVEAISYRTAMPKKDILKVVELFMETVKASVGMGENVYLRGFGTFSQRTYHGSTCNLPNRDNIKRDVTTIKFKPSKYFTIYKT